MTKRCTRCGSEKPIGDFGSHRGQPDGKAKWCRECARLADQARRSDPEVRRRAAEYARRRRERPEVKARIRVTDAAWKSQHRDLRRQYDTSDKKRAKARLYISTPEAREKRRLNEANRRAAKRRSGHLPLQEWLEVLEAFQYRCAYCLTPDVPLQIEHVEPLSKGGSHTKSNVVPACKECNMRKSNQSLLAFLAVA